jgi:hypothetical protein
MLQGELITTFNFIMQEEHMALYQAEDTIIYKNKSYHLSISPLGHFFKVAEVESPFSGNCSTNWRGYIAQWRVENDKLYLFGLQEDDSAPPGGSFESMFPGQDKVFADWFTGELPLFDFSNDNTYEVLTIENGCLLAHQSRQREITGGDVPDDWGDCVEKKDYVRKKQTRGDVLDDSWMERLWAWADKNNIDEMDLPRDKSGVTNLKNLNLSRNNLTELPKEIGQLTNLQELNLYDNKLTELPKEIGKLTNLKNLYLYDNKLTELPKEIGQLTNLKNLNLARNNLTELPKEIGQLTNLQELYLPKGLWPADTLLPRGLFLDNTWSSKSKVQRYLNEKIIYICAVNKRGSTSKPIKIYRADKYVKLPKEFVLRLDSAADSPGGREALKISNYNHTLIGTHNKAYLEETLKGFRRRGEDGATYIIVTLQTENLKIFTEQEEEAREELMSKVTYLGLCTVLQTEEVDISSLCVTPELYQILEKHMRDYKLQTTFFNHRKGVERVYTHNYCLQRSGKRHYIKQGGRPFPRSVDKSKYSNKTVKVCTPSFEDMCHGILRDYRRDVLYINR